MKYRGVGESMEKLSMEISEIGSQNLPVKVRQKYENL